MTTEKENNILQKLPQDQLEKQINATKAYINRQKKKSADAKDAEVDLCYLEREIEHRERGAELHKRYLKELEEQKKEFDRLLKEEEEALLEDNCNDNKELL